eukprot:GSMAST32.ASY1.ANO1.944.1 assembled CDS
MKPSEIINFILQQTGYLDYLRINKKTEQTKRHNISVLKEDILAYEIDLKFETNTENKSKGSENLRRCILSVLQRRQMEKHSKHGIKTRADAVVVSTIHQAKGLEWPVVFLMRFNERIIPLIEQHEEILTPIQNAYKSAKVASSSLTNGVRWGMHWKVPQRNFATIETLADDLNIMQNTITDVRFQFRIKLFLIFFFFLN